MVWVCFEILLFGIYLGFGILGFGISAQLGAQSLNQIYSKLGNINSSGLPQIKIPLGNVTELARYGFTFALSHNIVTGYNGTARTEWKITGLRTCVCLNDNGDLVWVRPDSRQIVFKKRTIINRNAWNGLLSSRMMPGMLNLPQAPGKNGNTGGAF